MKKSPWFVALVLFLAVVASACSDDGPPEPASTGDPIPAESDGTPVTDTGTG